MVYRSTSSVEPSNDSISWVSWDCVTAATAGVNAEEGSPLFDVVVARGLSREDAERERGKGGGGYMRLYTGFHMSRGGEVSSYTGFHSSRGGGGEMRLYTVSTQVSREINNIIDGFPHK